MDSLGRSQRRLAQIVHLVPAQATAKTKQNSLEGATNIQQRMMNLTPRENPDCTLAVRSRVLFLTS
jgi:hypothetical protein